MKKFLVPTDFSDTAKNAARFAAQALNNVPDATIILYNVHDNISSGSDSSPLTETENDRMVILNRALLNLREELQPLTQARIECVADRGSSLVDTLERYVRHYGVQLVIMGITGATRLEQIFMGSNTLKLVESSVCPVMIVPPNAAYRQIRNVVFASDFKDVQGTTPIAPIKAILDIFKPSLHIVNVDHEHYVELTEEYKRERAILEKMFEGYSPEFYFIRQYDFQEAISQFAQDKNIDLIVIVPRKNSFFSSLFRSSHTKKLAYHSHVPIVAIQE